MGRALRAENRTVTSLEIAYLTERRKKTYIACEELNFLWCETEVNELIEMWKKGKSGQEIAEYFDREPDEVALLIFDLSRNRKIKPRKRGLMGCE